MLVEILVTYYSKSGNTEKMAKAVSEGAAEVEGVNVTLKKVEEVNVDELLNYDGLIVGSPTYYGLPAAQVKRLFDESVKHHGKLEGKVGGAFTSSAWVGGGNETTIMAIFQAMFVHGLIIQGYSKKSHYGPVSVEAPDEKVLDECRELGGRVALLAKKVKG
jgi:NAD(P)H dehydrogenase (quinone)